MNTLHTRGYKESRNWADRYNESLNQIGMDIICKNNLMSVHFVLPTLHQDRKQGIDMQVVVEDINMSYRVRKASTLPYFYKGFTIRTETHRGPCELDKIQTDNFAHFLVYGIAHPEKYGEIMAAVMVDLKSVGACLLRDPSIIEKATKGKGFIEFAYDAFPYPVVVGTYGINEKGEIECL